MLPFGIVFELGGVEVVEADGARRLGLLDALAGRREAVARSSGIVETVGRDDEPARRRARWPSVSATIGSGSGRRLGCGRDHDRRPRQEQVGPDRRRRAAARARIATPTDQPGVRDAAARGDRSVTSAGGPRSAVPRRPGRRRVGRGVSAATSAVDVDGGARIAVAGAAPRRRRRRSGPPQRPRPQPATARPGGPVRSRAVRAPSRLPRSLSVVASRTTAAGSPRAAGDDARRQRPAPPSPAADSLDPSAPRQRRLVLGDRREDRQPGRGRQRPRRRVPGDDRQPLVVGHRVAGQQPEVDPRRRDPRAVRQHDRDARRLGGADARRRRGDLVVDVEVDDPAGHGQTFIARSTRRRATSRASSVVWSSIAW